ncbi:MAG TPA: hypothetical protein VMZ71_14495, partial [Gemmataceae bacterium]|nr:hypothetical protein [Gemmataceae bacterium]
SAVAGVLLAVVWYRWKSIPHAVDMCVGMLTLGNLGMLLGWYADNGLRTCHCASAVWMWVGMLAFANAAMVWLGRRSIPQGDHAWAMFTGGNVGMVGGMIAGGWVVAGLGSVAAHFAGMTLGMLGGMLLGTWVAEGVTAFARHQRFRRSGQGSAQTRRTFTHVR